jgi:hypothetical protein
MELLCAEHRHGGGQPLRRGRPGPLGNPEGTRIFTWRHLFPPPLYNYHQIVYIYLSYPILSFIRGPVYKTYKPYLIYLIWTKRSYWGGLEGRRG